jgi:hypothetical protein
MAFVVRALIPTVRGDIQEDVARHFRVVAASEAEAVNAVGRLRDTEGARDVFVSGRTI